MGLKHSFVSTKVDGTDATLVRPSDWNADHVFSGAVQGMTTLGVGTVAGSASGPALAVRSASIGDNNSAFVVQSPNDQSLAFPGKVNFYINPIGNLYLNTSINIVGNHGYMGTLDNTGNFTLNGDPRGNTDLAAMLDIYADTTLCVGMRVSSAGGAYGLQMKDPVGAYVYSIESDGSIKWGESGSGGPTTHGGMDTKLGRVAGGSGQQGTLIASGGSSPMFMVGNSYTDAVMIQYSAGAVILRTVQGASQSGIIDISAIQPSGGFDFGLKQNSVTSFSSTTSGAVVNTLVLDHGRVGVGTSPASGCMFEVADVSTSMTMKIGNNTFGSDWVVFNQDSALSTTKYFLAASQAGSGTTILNCQSGGEVDLRVNNATIVKVTGTLVNIANGNIPSSDPHVVGQLFRTGTALQISQG